MPVRCDEALHLLQPMLEQGQAPCAGRHRAGPGAGAGKILWLLTCLPHRELHLQLGRQKRSRHSPEPEEIQLMHSSRLAVPMM